MRMFMMNDTHDAVTMLTSPDPRAYKLLSLTANQAHQLTWCCIQSVKKNHLSGRETWTERFLTGARPSISSTAPSPNSPPAPLQ
jgi:hypothetical protein